MLPQIISLHQQGYIKNIYIGYSIRIIQYIIDYTNLLKIEGAILYLDFRKAFDMVEWNFMFRARKLGFGNSFINWVKTYMETF